MATTLQALRSDAEPLPAIFRSETERLIEEAGVDPEEAVSRSLFELDRAREGAFRHAGLRWDE
jgi:hypothetical protein